MLSLLVGSFLLDAVHAVPGVRSALASTPQALSSRAAYSPSAKAGFSWTDTSVDITPFISDKVSWYYNWSPTPELPSSAMNGLEYVPMLWGTNQLQEFNDSVPALIAQNVVTSVLGFNEPESATQANISPKDGASTWRSYLEPLKQANGNIRLGSPAPTSAPSGKEWLNEFLGNCTDIGGCTVDFIALHWYDINATQFIDYLTDFHDTFQRPIWVTEWACQNFNNKHDQCSMAEIEAFLNTTQSFMDETSWVERYAWFGAFRQVPDGVNKHDALLNNNGNITDLGLQYIGEKAYSSGGVLSSCYQAHLVQVGLAILLSVSLGSVFV